MYTINRLAALIPALFALLWQILKETGLLKMAEFDFLVDARGENCPMPLLRAKLKLNEMSAGERLKVLATDAGSVRDFEAFIALTPHELSSECSDDEYVYFIIKR